MYGIKAGASSIRLTQSHQSEAIGAAVVAVDIWLGGAALSLGQGLRTVVGALEGMHYVAYNLLVLRKAGSYFIWSS